MRCPRCLGVLLHRVTLTYLLVVALWIVAGQLRPGFASYGHLRYLVELAAVIGIVGGRPDARRHRRRHRPLGRERHHRRGDDPAAGLGAWDPTGLAGAAAVLLLCTGIGLVNGLGHRPPAGASADHDPRHGDDPPGRAGADRRRQRHLGHQPDRRGWLANSRPFGVPSTIVTWIVVASSGPVPAAPDRARRLALRHRHQRAREPAGRRGRRARPTSPSTPRPAPARAWPACCCSA